MNQCCPFCQNSLTSLYGQATTYYCGQCQNSLNQSFYKYYYQSTFPQFQQYTIDNHIIVNVFPHKTILYTSSSSLVAKIQPQLNAPFYLTLENKSEIMDQMRWVVAFA
jgi:hypothetical protein